MLTVGCTGCGRLIDESMRPVAHAIAATAEGTSQAVACSIGSGFDFLSAHDLVDITLESNFINDKVVPFIKSNKISSVEQFQKIEPSGIEQPLTEATLDAYDQSLNKNPQLSHTINQFQKLLIRSLIYLVNEQPSASGGRFVQTKLRRDSGGASQTDVGYEVELTINSSAASRADEPNVAFCD